MSQDSPLRIEIEGDLLLDTAAASLQQGLSALAALPAGDAVIDLAKVTAVDSAGLAAVFAWLRAGKAAQRTLAIANPPAQLMSLGAVYGVSDLIPLVSPQ